MIRIDWAAFWLVLVASLAASVVIVAFYSVALRLLSLGADARRRPPAAVAGAIVCLAVCGAAVLYGIYLVVPLFHGR